MAWNNALDTANAFTQALNLINTTNVSLESSAAGATSWPKPPAPRATAICLAGTQGRGTQSAPCATPTCAGLGSIETGDTGCISSRFKDSYGNVIVYLTLKTEIFKTDNTDLTLLN